MTVADLVLEHAARAPERLALVGPDEEVTYGELARRVKSLPARSVITARDPVRALTTALAADLAGIVPLICDPAAARLVTPEWTLSGPGWASFTSGSTGRPRAVLRSRESWRDSFPHLNALAGVSEDDVVLVPGPLVSSLYGFAAAHALGVGATAIVPGRWSLEHLGRASVVHLVPHQLPQVLPKPPSLRVAVVGGAALDPAVRAQAEGLRVVAYYGATELSFVAADPDGNGLRAFPETEIEVREGVVWVRSPWVAKGYLGPAAGPLRRDAAGWASVGDLAGPYTPGGVLRVRGRGDGAIQTGGATVVPEDVEAVLRRVPGVLDAVVVGSPHPELGAVVTAVVEGDGVRRAALEAAARDGLDPVQRPRRWYAAGSLPRNATGKPARALVAEGLTGFRRLV
ncbi:class I adenylate-forming enzyme family protein [Nonomuraea typhae]|uniref:class I adenylate-forming enzyme family protein n=1 Tax=Nonomuraea typhae TaxID=2603600 RepID=UPI0012F740D7|nr:AMP-binding protein [Nonomuraea typhae]